VRVIDARSGKLTDSLLGKEVSALRPVEEWLRNGGAAIGKALETATALIAEQVIDEIFLVYHPAALRHEPSAESGTGEKQRVPQQGLPQRAHDLRPPRTLSTRQPATLFPLGVMAAGLRHHARERAGAGPARALRLQAVFRREHRLRMAWTDRARA